jgi:penicillin-binding protein 1C
MWRFNVTHRNRFISWAGDLISVKMLVMMAAVFAVILAGLFAGGLTFIGARTPSFADVRHAFHPSDSWVLDRNGEPLEVIRVAQSNRTLDWVSIGDISPSFKKLLIESEDRRFMSHVGVDFFALTQASRHRGASTLTMQLANQIAKRRRAVHDSRTRPIVRKIEQIFEALRLDHKWTKDQILEAYVNLVPFRGELVGLRAASVGLFAKAPQSLDETESAILVAMIRSPNAPIDQVARRACAILKQVSDCKEVDGRTRSYLSLNYKLSRERSRVPILSKSFVIAQPANAGQGGVIQTTLDAFAQDTALTAIREQMRELKDKNVGDAAVIVMKTETGEIVAYAGNGGSGFSTATQIDGVKMRRQAGSTLKPFVYGTAFDLNLLNISSLVEDSPEDLAVGGGGIYSPKNYDHDFQGLVASGEALGSSLNVPAVRTLELVKESRVLDRMKDLGFSELQSDDHYGPSLALGTVDVSLQELTNAYRQLSLFAPSPIFSNKAKSQIFAALSLPEYRRYTFGLDSLLSLPFPAAVKTGTSKDMRDNWCIGFTSEYTVGVWVGNFDGQPMWNVSGMTGAAPIWRKLMLSLHPRPPRDQLMTYLPPAKPLIKKTLSRIRYPQINMLIGLDPDIPAPRQRLPIQIDHPQKSQTLFVDGKRLAGSQDVVFWNLKKGRHEVELKTSDGHRIDDVSFVVR